MHLLSTLLAYLLALGILVTFHELGHYLAARAMGVKVLRFSFGFGPVLASRRFGRDGTEWALCALPLGGYVKMLDSSESPVAAADSGRAFNLKSVWARMAIVSAGPVANLLLAVLLYWAMFLHGVPAMLPVLAEPAPGTAAALAGLHARDQIAGIDGEHIASWNDVDWMLLRHTDPTQPLVVRLTDGQISRLQTGKVHVDDERHPVSEQLGLDSYEPPVQPVIGEILADSVAARAGLRIGDRILAINHTPMPRWQDVVTMVRDHPAQVLVLHIARNGQVFDLFLTPAAMGESGRAVGKIGAGPYLDKQMFAGLMTVVRYSFFPALGHAWIKTGQTISLNLSMIVQLVSGRVSWHSLSGPFTIADYAGQSARMGWIPFAGFLAVISVGLGVLNLLPIPLLDGGHLMYYIAELVRGSAVPEWVVELGQRLGMAALLTLMLLAFYNDLTRLSGS